MPVLLQTLGLLAINIAGFTNGVTQNDLKSAFDAERPYTSKMKFAKGFVGHDVSKIYARLLELDSPKGEYETIEEYERRLREQESKPLFGEIYRSSMLAVPLDCFARYDADASIQMVDVPYEFDFDRLTIGSVTTFTIVKGQAPFGVYSETITDPSRQEFDSFLSLKFAFSLNRDKAKRMSNDIGVALVFLLGSPMTQEFERLHGLKQRNSERSTVVRALHAKTMRFVIYRKSTGETLSEQEPKLRDSKQR